MSARTPVEGKWTYEFLQDSFADPATCLLSYCCPCIVYGQLATAVHGGDCFQWGLKICLFSCVCLSGLVAGPTRRAVRDAYKLPPQPANFGPDDPKQLVNNDCLLYTIPCTACFALCQDANETRDRNISTPLLALEPWNPTVYQPTAVTTAPKQETMEPVKPAAAEPPKPDVTVEPTPAQA